MKPHYLYDIRRRHSPAHLLDIHLIAKDETVEEAESEECTDLTDYDDDIGRICHGRPLKREREWT